ncbi:Chloride channel protein CLC-d, partial [Cucurbita argyrosperma subsp. sororia]
MITSVGDVFNEGLYEEQAQLKGIPLLESRPKYQMRKITAKEACGKRVIDYSRNGETRVVGPMLRRADRPDRRIHTHRDVERPLLNGLGMAEVSSWNGSTL